MLVHPHDRRADRRDPVQIAGLIRLGLHVLEPAAQTPACDHRLKFLYSVFQFPNRSGTSRHAAPVRNRHAVASTTACASTGDRPVAFKTHPRATENTFSNTP